jgi:uncharacterized protein YbgA (DUF1722 family)
VTCQCWPPQYFSELMTALKKCATRGTHSNVLQHISGYLKQALSAADKQEMQALISQYRQGIVPLVVPLTLLKHHFRQHPDRYISRRFTCSRTRKTSACVMRSDHE